MNGHGEINTDAFCIGNFTIKPSRNLVVIGTQSFTLEPRIMDVLCELAAHPREVVSRDTLIKSVWNVEYGADESLTRAISILRKNFRGAGAVQSFIQTIPKRGYRLTIDVTQIAETTQEVVPKTIPGLSQKPTTPRAAPPAPIKMVEADISGFVPNPSPAQPRKFNIRKIVLAVALPLILGTLSVFFWLQTKNKLGQSLSISQYGRTVAVLSLVDMSAESELEYFADGMAEEILSVLTQVPDLQVAGRTSSFSFKGKKNTIREIGTALKVSHIIDGSVRKQGEQIKITLRLNNSSNGAQVWSKTYHGALDNAFALQEEISQDIIINLELILGISVQQAIDVDL